MKRTIVTLLIAGAMITPAMTSFAQETVDTPVLISAETEAPAYESTMVESAKAADIEKYINDETTIIGKDGKLADAVNEGDKFFVDTAKNTAVILDSGYEGSISADVYSANGGDETGESLINSSKTLVLHVSDDTEITDLDGNKVEKSELDGKLMAVYYSVTTRSLPPQTTPEKIVVIGDAENELPSNWSGVVESFEDNVIKSGDNSFTVMKDTVILNDKETIEKGDMVFINAEKNVVAVTDGDYVGSVDIDLYNKSAEGEFGEYINSEKTLTISIGEDTKITDLRGNEVSKDSLDNSVLAVYHTIDALSMPAQTNPEKIVVIDAELPAATEYSFVYGDKTFTAAFTEKDGSKYVPVRAIAEALGFVVDWDGENITVSVSEDDKTTAFKVYETKLNENGAAAYISNEDRTYVPVEFFSEIIPAELGSDITVELK